MDQSSSINNSIPNNLVDCGAPTVLKGARILADSFTTTETSQINLICGEGLFSNYTITSVCTKEGAWYPDPAEFSCLPETSGMFNLHDTICTANLLINITVISISQDPRIPVTITVTLDPNAIVCISH